MKIKKNNGLSLKLINNPDILILDEATSALDDETELAVMDSIENFDEELTVVIIAHRITTLKSCDMIIKLNSDYTMQILSYEELMNFKINAIIVLLPAPDDPTKAVSSPFEISNVMSFKT